MTPRPLVNTRIPYLVLGAGCLAAIPHMLNLSAVLGGFFLAILTWCFIRLQIPRLQPGRWILLLMTLLGGLLVYTQHHSLWGRDAGVSLLTLMLGLKLLEVTSHRDVYVVVFISYFVVLTQFLYSQALLLTLYLLVVVILLTALLLELNRVTPSQQLVHPLRKTLSITLQGLPVAALLFFLFPRLSQPLWQLGFSDNAAFTGLSERITMGSISQLIQSPAIAFRVKFVSAVPDPDQRYWRALVIWDTDGFAWFNRQQTNANQTTAWLLEADAALRYEIFLEPHNQQWLYALDLPEHAPPGSRLNADFTILSQQPVDRPKQYQLLSNTHYRTGPPSQYELKRALAVPANVTEQMRKLVLNWRNKANSDAHLVRLALQHFSTQAFVYTLNPPRYLDNPMHQFLFEAREGFCEHYASSLTLLMRLSGIPARMVVGFQGGEYNPLGDYYSIRQYDAHAWSEVWLPHQGWTRVDPTAAVAPDRVRHPIDLNFTDAGYPVRFQLDEEGLVGSLVLHLRQAMDAANIGWRRWILDYSQQRQFKLMQNLGVDMSRVEQWLTLTLTMIGLILSLVAMGITLNGRRRQDPLVKIYQRFCIKLARAGLPRRPAEGPLDYSRRIATQRPDLITQVEKILDTYIRLRYGPHPTHTTVRYFAEQVRSFRPKKPVKQAN